MDESTLTKQYNALVQAVGNMNARLDQITVLSRAYRLPIHTDHTIPGYLDVDRLSGTDSLTAAKAAYSQFEFDEDQDARTAFRLAGLVVVSADDFARTVADVNAMKRALKTAIHELMPEKHKRSYTCNRLFPKVAMGQVYRQIVLLGSDVKAVHFTWMRRTVGSRRMSKNEAIEYVDQNIAKEDALGHYGRVAALGETLNHLSSITSSTHVYCRKAVPPHPRANVMYQDGTKTMHHANLPFAICGGSSNIDVVDLCSFDVANRRRLRSDSQRLVCLHEGLQIYVEQR